MADRESLSLDKYLSVSDRKVRILIVSDVSKGNTLLRMYEKKTGDMVQNVSCQNLNWVVNQIYIYEQAEKGFKEEYELIDDQTALMMFRSVLLDAISSLKYYNGKEKLLSIATSKEIFDKVNLMRSNKCVLGDDNNRISDLKNLIDRYETELGKQKKHDRVARTKYVLDCLRKGSVSCKDVFGAKAEFAYLKEETEQYSSMQNEILEKIAASEVLYFDKVIDEETVLMDLSAKKDKIRFFKGMGSYNEANYVAYDILHNGYNFGDTLVLYNSAAQLPAIRTALMGNGIPMRVVSTYPATENDVISLARSIIAWAMDDYSEKALEKIFGNPIIYVPGEIEVKTDDKKKDEDDADDSNEDITEDNTDDSNLSEEEKTKIKKRNLLAGSRYYKYVLNARRMGKEEYCLGWGYQRNRDFAKHERKYTEENASKDKEHPWRYTATDIIDMHEAMLDIFKEIGLGGTLSPSALFDLLYRFVKEYTRPCFAKNEETNRYKKIDDSREIGLGLLGNLSKALAYDSRELDAEELLSFADEALSSTRLSDSADYGSVTVRAMNDWVPIDRPNVYVIGLSLNEMQLNSNQSPVICDEEMEKYLSGKGVFIPTIENRIEREIRILWLTLASFSEGNLAFGYSYWDAEKNTEMNPSFFFSNLYEHLNDDDRSIVCFEYGNPTEGKPAFTVTASEKSESVFEGFQELELSSTSLETLLECPKSFAFNKALCISDEEYCEKDPGHWLNPLNKGTFFHEVLKEYSDSDLHLKTDPLSDSEKEKIRQITLNIRDTMMIQKSPIAAAHVTNEETEHLIEEEIIKYIDDLRKDMRENGWKIWKPEVEFDDLILTVKTYDNKDVPITLKSGFIDCIDYRLIEDESLVQLRIRDYKTGKFVNKRNSYNRGELIQCWTYPTALMQDILLDKVREDITELEGGKTAGWNFVFAGFEYDFPSDRKESGTESNYNVIPVSSDEIKGLNEARLRAILTVMSEMNSYPDVLDLKERITDETTGLAVKYSDPRLENLKTLFSEVNKFAEPCKHCDYKDLCIKRKSGKII